MFKILANLLLAVLLLGCASAPSTFQKNVDDSYGYSVVETTSKDRFRVLVNLPSDKSEVYVRYYGYRAVGEECVARGFDRFDFSDVNATTFEGFCLSAPLQSSLPSPLLQTQRSSLAAPAKPQDSIAGMQNGSFGVHDLDALRTLIE